MHAAAILAGHIKPLERGAAVCVEFDAAHHVMRGGEHLDIAAREIETAIGAAFHHALELFGDLFRSQMRHADMDAAIGGAAPGAHFLIHGARNDIARRALAMGVNVQHEAFPGAVEQITAGAAQTLFENGAGHARVVAGENAGGVELHHLHIAQAQTASQPHGQAVAGLVAARGVIAVHGRPAAGAKQDRFGLHEAE